MRTDSMKQSGKAALELSDHSFEVTGLGVIAALTIAFGSLVNDGTLPLSQYLVFFAMLMVGASVLVWRIFKLAPAHVAKSGEPRQKTALRD
jgi:hypothetical protein